MTDLRASLRKLVGERHVLTEAADTAPYLRDWRGRYAGEALCVVRPSTTEEVAQVVERCAKAEVAMVPQGGNTGLCGGATPIGGEVLISLARLNRVRSIDPDNSTIVVESGCTLHAVQEAARTAGKLFPLSIASEGSATIGGCLSTNAGGVQVLRYGNARDLTLGLEVVLPDGRIWNGLRGLRKDNTGYDLKQLFIGAEGTLGLITAAVLKLSARQCSIATAWVSLASPAAAVSLLSEMRGNCGDRLTSFELIDAASLELVLRHIPDTRNPLPKLAAWQVLIELSDAGVDDLNPLLAARLEESRAVFDAVLAQSEAQRLALWRLRENVSEAQKIEGFSIKHDIAVPVSRIAEFVTAASEAMHKEFPDVRVVCFGHVGDGNLHYNVSMANSVDNATLLARSGEINGVVHGIADRFGGSISAEHGLGQLKREEIKRYKSVVELDLMRSIKRALDPNGLLNPGKVL